MSTDRPRYLPDAPCRRDCLLAALGMTLMLATGCAGVKITRVSLSLTASADVNPDPNGRASPLTVRLYALRSPSAFNSADFFSLYDKDSATLGADLAQREEMVLRPGETRKFDFSLQPDAKAIGVMAAYRDLKYAHWRESQMLKAGKRQRLDLFFGARKIQITQR